MHMFIDVTMYQTIKGIWEGRTWCASSRSRQGFQGALSTDRTESYNSSCPCCLELDKCTIRHYPRKDRLYSASLPLIMFVSRLLYFTSCFLAPKPFYLFFFFYLHFLLFDYFGGRLLFISYCWLVGCSNLFWGLFLIFSIEFFNHTLHVDQVFKRLPGWFFSLVVFPMYQIFEFPIFTHFTVQNLFHCILAWHD